MKRSLELHRGHVQWLENLAVLEEHAGNSEDAGKLRAVLERRKKGIQDETPSDFEEDD
jgi:hypothetical protein